MSTPAGTNAPWALGLAALGACAVVSRRRRA
jgi:MYXO-CTERM domain-containing protein